jgi:hypothetical protein
MTELLAIETVSKGAGPSLKEQIVGVDAAELAGANASMLSTPHGVVTLLESVGRLVVVGGTVPRGEVEAPDPVSIPAARRGLRGRVDGRELTMMRPHFGLRLRHRSVLMRSSSVQWRSVMRSYRSFEIRLRDTDEVILTRRGSSERVSAGLSAEELVIALLFGHCGIIQCSSLVNFVTF